VQLHFHQDFGAADESSNPIHNLTAGQRAENDLTRFRVRNWASPSTGSRGRSRARTQWILMVRYLASPTDCRPCPSRRQCCSGNQRYGRSIVVTHEDPVVSAFRSRKKLPETKALIRERGRVAEFVNAWLKDKLGLRRFRVRGLAKAGTEALWALLAYNIRQWIRLRWKPRITAATA
jgi:hypothetical protein